jgi:hypothetical protein
MGIKRSECSDAEFSAKLLRGYDAAVAAGHPAHEDYNRWRAIGRGESVEPAEDKGTEGETPLGGGGPGSATDSRRWRAANPAVRQAMDAAMKIPGIDQGARRAVAEAALRHAGYSPDDGLFAELSAYLNQAMTPRGAADATRRMIPGLDRLK